MLLTRLWKRIMFVQVAQILFGLIVDLLDKNVGSAKKKNLLKQLVTLS